MNDLRKQLAAFEHAQWGRWATYWMNNLSVANLEAWAAEADAKFDDLSVSDQEGYLNWADKVLEIVQKPVCVCRAHKWIDVEERLPNDTRPVWVRTRGVMVTLAWYDRNRRPHRWHDAKKGTDLEYVLKWCESGLPWP